MLREKLKTWLFLQQQLQQGRSAAFWVVVDDWGSAPGKRGFLLAMTEDGGWSGTIGGGIMEHDIFHRSLRMLQSAEETKTLLLKRTHHERAPEHERSGMICAGGQWLAGGILHPHDQPTIERILHAEQHGPACAWRIDPRGLSFLQEPVTTAQFIREDTHWSYTEPCGQPDTLYILGGGHVGLAIAKQFIPLTFRCIVIDPRPDSLVAKEPDCCDMLHIRPFEEAQEIVEQGPHSYAVIVTKAMDSDALALRSIIHKDLRYLGVMGSKRKIHAIFQKLEQSGISTDLFSRVHAPMGLPIGGQTPAEIAVSLAAQVIQIRHAKAPSLRPATDDHPPASARSHDTNQPQDNTP